MMKYGLSPRSGNLVQVVKPAGGVMGGGIFHVRVIAHDRIYCARYSERKIVSGFDPISRRQWKRLADERRQFKLF